MVAARVPPRRQLAAWRLGDRRGGTGGEGVNACEVSLCSTCVKWPSLPKQQTAASALYQSHPSTTTTASQCAQIKQIQRGVLDIGIAAHGGSSGATLAVLLARSAHAPRREPRAPPRAVCTCTVKGF